MPKQSYYILVGRIPEGENETHCYGPCTRRAAIRSFERDVFASDDRSKAKVKREYGLTVIHDAIIRCDTPPHIE